MNDDAIDVRRVETIEALAGLSLEAAARVEMAIHLSDMALWMQALADAPRLESPPVPSALRPDLPQPFPASARQKALDAAPARDGDAFQVPKVVGGS